LVSAALTGVTFEEHAEIECGGELFLVDFLATQMGALVQPMDEYYSSYRLVIPRFRFNSLIPTSSSEIAELKVAVARIPNDPRDPHLFSPLGKGAALERSVLFATALEVWLAVTNKGAAAAKIGEILQEIVSEDGKYISVLKETDSLPIVHDNC